MSIIGKSITIKGEVRALEHLTIEGRVHGPVFCENGSVTVAAGALVRGDILAHDVTIHGTVDGQLIATDIVDVRPDAVVTAQVMSKGFILDERAYFVGRVEPQHLQAALSVARYGQRKRDRGE